MNKNLFNNLKSRNKILIIILVIFAIFLIPKIIKKIERNKQERIILQKAYEDLSPKYDTTKFLTEEEILQKAYEDLSPPSEKI